MMLLQTLVNGSSSMEETVFENRFMHVPEFNRMGADITIRHGVAFINGGLPLTGAEVMSSDLRAGAALVLAGLAADGVTVVNRVYHIDRGYDKLECIDDSEDQSIDKLTKDLMLRYKIPDIDDELLDAISHYVGNGRDSKLVNTRVRDRILRLSKQLSSAKSDEEFKNIVTEFYKEYGVGKFGLNKAFRIEESNDLNSANIIPITRVEHVYLKDIIGYDIQKKKLIYNTESFINGKPANNCLLYGDAGTGKSSSVKAIVNEYYDKGLRIIEIYKHQFRYLSDILEQLKDRNYKFIIYMDDLSFEESELEYKYLKAILEGGFGKRPENVLIYATSNRRHLIRESFRDKTETDEELHSRDTVEEKLSLSARFGEKIYYGSPDKKEFNDIVLSLAKKHGIDMDEKEILAKANMWELSHGGMSGRSATQFITYLQGQK